MMISLWVSLKCSPNASCSRIFFFFFFNKFGAMSLGCIKHSTNILSYHEGDKTSQVIDATGKWCGANGQSLHYLRPSGGRVANDIQKNICLAFLTSEAIWIRLSFYWITCVWDLLNKQKLFHEKLLPSKCNLTPFSKNGESNLSFGIGSVLYAYILTWTI